jgi:GT2 family glycosyltransferase
MALLTLGVLTRGSVSTEWAFALRELKLPKDTVFVKRPGIPFDHARNQMVRTMLENGSKWLLFLDDDVIPPPDAFDKLLSVQNEVASGVYWKRQGKIVPTAYFEAHPLPTPLPHITGDLPIDVDLVGGGLLLIHRSVFEKIKEPWFEWKICREDLPNRERVGEDFDFCRKVKAVGLRIVLHQGVRCRHAGPGWSDENGKFVPEPPAELI